MCLVNTANTIQISYMYIITWKLKLQRRRVEEVLLELIKLNNILKELYSKKFSFLRRKIGSEDCRIYINC